MVAETKATMEEAVATALTVLHEQEADVSCSELRVWVLVAD